MACLVILYLEVDFVVDHLERISLPTLELASLPERRTLIEEGKIFRLCAAQSPKHNIAIP